MRHRQRLAVLLWCWTGLAIGQAPFTYLDRDLFVSETNALRVSVDYPSGLNNEPFWISGDIQLGTTQPATLNFQQWTTALAGNDVAVNGIENLTVASFGEEVYALGIEFHDSTDSSVNAGSTPSTFVALAIDSAGTTVGEFRFETPREIEANFIGIWSPIPFRRISLVELGDAGENEFFGAVYAGRRPPPGVHKLRAPVPQQNARFGSNLVLQDQLAIVTDATRAHWFAADSSGLWRHTGESIDPAGGGIFDLAGAPGQLIFGFGSFQGRGAIRIYERQHNNSWLPQPFLVASDGAIGDFFGQSVAISGNYAVVGAYLDDDQSDESGSAYVLERQPAGDWQEVQKITTDDAIGETRFRFGRSVAIEGPYLAIGTDTADVVYLYEHTPSGKFAFVHRLLEDDLLTGSRFGSALAFNGTTLLVGAPAEQTQTGRVFVFQRNGSGQWLQVDDFIADDAVAGSSFGFDLALDENTAVIGSVREDDGLTNSGASYLFQRSSDGSWTQSAKLLAPDRADGDFGGAGVDIDQGLVAMSARDDGDFIENSGAAYVFDLILFQDSFEFQNGKDQQQSNR